MKTGSTGLSGVALEAVSKLGKRMDMRSEGPVVNRPGRQAGIE
jgi:hypothetical protein